MKIDFAQLNGFEALNEWGYICFSLQDDNSVRSFLDCAWVSTDILKRNELDHPEDADLIIGYLFQVIIFCKGLLLSF